MAEYYRNQYFEGVCFDIYSRMETDQSADVSGRVTEDESDGEPPSDSVATGQSTDRSHDDGEGDAPSAGEEATSDGGGWAISRKAIAGISILSVVSLFVPGFEPSDNVAGRAVDAVAGEAGTYTGIETQHVTIVVAIALLILAVTWWFPRGKWVVIGTLASLGAFFGSASMSLLDSSHPTTMVTLLNGNEIPVAAVGPGIGLIVSLLVVSILSILAWCLALLSTGRWLRRKLAGA